MIWVWVLRSMTVGCDLGLVVVDLRFWVVTMDISVGSWCCGWTWVRRAMGSSSPQVLGLMDRKAVEIEA